MFEHVHKVIRDTFPQRNGQMVVKFLWDVDSKTKRYRVNWFRENKIDSSVIEIRCIDDNMLVKDVTVN